MMSIDSAHSIVTTRILNDEFEPDGEECEWELADVVKSLGNLEKYFYQEKTESVNEGFEKYHLGNVGDSKLKNRLERAIKIWGGKVDAVGMDTIKFRLSSSDVMKFPALLKKLDRNKNVWIGDKRKNNVYDRKQNINKLGEAISKAEWSQYPKYARKLKPYMKKLLKVPVRVRVIKQANHSLNFVCHCLFAKSLEILIAFYKNLSSCFSWAKIHIF